PVVSVLAVSTRAPRCSPVAFLSAITLRPPRPCVAPVSFGSLRTCGAFLGSLSGLATAQTLITGKLRVFLADVLQLIRECLGAAFRFGGMPYGGPAGANRNAGSGSEDYLPATC